MQTYLINSSDQKFISKAIDKIVKKLNIAPINHHTVTPDNSIGIEEVRKIGKLLTLKPFGGGERVVVINRVEKATLEAQNAMLKFLEEPPVDNTIILTSINVNNLLPTIVSRCQIITPKTQPSSDQTGPKTGTHILTKILSGSPGERLLIAQELSKSKEEAINSLEQILSSLQDNLSSSTLKITPLQSAILIKKILWAKYYIEKNINLKATMDILFLGFPQIRS